MFMLHQFRNLNFGGKGLIALLLPSTAVTKTVNTFELGQTLLDVKHDHSLQLMSKIGVMLQIIRDDAQWDVMKYTILLEIYRHSMHGTLILVPVISLNFILHHIVIILSKIQENDMLCLCYFFFPLFEMLSLALCDEGVCCKFVNTVHQQLDEIAHISCVCP